jgi:hypothetical protein
MRDLPTADYPDKKGVTLKCRRYYEAVCLSLLLCFYNLALPADVSLKATYRDPIGAQRVFANFRNIIKQVPTHLIYGAIDDYM